MCRKFARIIKRTPDTLLPDSIAIKILPHSHSLPHIQVIIYLNYIFELYLFKLYTFKLHIIKYIQIFAHLRISC